MMRLRLESQNYETKIAGYPQGAGNRNEAGRTVVRDPREESDLCHGKKTSR
jgi:hypothetical protein